MQAGDRKQGIYNWWPNQSCAVTQTTDAISAVNHTIDVIPAPLTSLYHERYQNMSDHQWKKEAERVFYSMEISDREAAAVEKATVAQHSSVQWRAQQSGCLTVSHFS